MAKQPATGTATRRANRFAVTGESTPWVAELDEFHLPKRHVFDSLLALHARPLHHTLTAKELSVVLPSSDESNLPVALLTSKIVERDGESHYG